jgi:16S rRNA (guanine(966)-N(2))-methyltransferase RsmD
VKQALFNIISLKIEGAVFLDLFAGAGGIGIEALSRGAQRVVFVDASRRSVDVVKHNIGQIGFGDRAEVVFSKAETFLKKASGPYDIVYLDPPYAEEMQPLLGRLAGAGILKPDSIVIAEHFKKQPSPESAGTLRLYREAQYGDTVLAFYKLGSQKSEAGTQQ